MDMPDLPDVDELALIDEFENFGDQTELSLPEMEEESPAVEEAEKTVASQSDGDFFSQPMQPAPQEGASDDTFEFSLDDGGDSKKTILIVGGVIVVFLILILLISSYAS